MSDTLAWNRKIIEEFRANKGKVGGRFENALLLLLTTTGARTRLPRTSPLACLPDGDRYIVFATNAGYDRNPDWYHNLVAHPEVTVEVGEETFAAIATVVTGEEHDELYARQVALYPRFGEYPKQTRRTIPVIALRQAP
ncbi:nitroreductase/quinone reductase family protein (plasmid) [Streptomyces sp. CG1]|uniref:nitroreductase/quinone reductase family protein n=1 Tax=Streptomyces sp. CG1 TaxID=1287523 RepID=UPI0034E1C6CD